MTGNIAFTIFVIISALYCGIALRRTQQFGYLLTWICVSGDGPNQVWFLIHQEWNGK